MQACYTSLAELVLLSVPQTLMYPLPGCLAERQLILWELLCPPTVFFSLLCFRLTKGGGLCLKCLTDQYLQP